MVVTARKIDELLQRVTMLQRLCTFKNFKFHPSKCEPYNRQANWCGRIISIECVRHHSRQINGIESMDCPTTAVDLLEFAAAL